MLILLLWTVTALSGCSTTNQAYYLSIQALFSDNEVSLTREEVSSRNADLLRVTRGERSAAVMALAFIENGRYKWVSADHALLTMHHGVVIETQGLDNDLLYVSNLKGNPLSDQGALPFRWSYAMDIEQVGFGLAVDNEWKVQGEEQLSVLDQPFTVIRITQTVSFPRTTLYWEAGLSWQNEYWFDKGSNQLLRSRQKVSPQGEWLDMVYLSRAARLLERGGQG